MGQKRVNEIISGQQNLEGNQQTTYTCPVTDEVCAPFRSIPSCRSGCTESVLGAFLQAGVVEGIKFEVLGGKVFKPGSCGMAVQFRVGLLHTTSVSGDSRRYCAHRVKWTKQAVPWFPPSHAPAERGSRVILTLTYEHTECGRLECSAFNTKKGGGDICSGPRRMSKVKYCTL